MNRTTKKKWKLKGVRATFDWEGSSYEVDVSRPDRGIRLGNPQSSESEFLFATPQIIVLKNERFDPFCRSSELHVAYPCSDERPIGGELSWRARIGSEAASAEEVVEDDSSADLQTQIDEQSEPAFSIELLYSIQTHLLDSQPEPQINSLLRGEEIEFFERGPNGTLESCSASGHLIACMIRRRKHRTLLTVMPSDLKSFRVGTEGGPDGLKEYNVAWNLNLEFLEKGVIRRMRTFCAISEDSAQLIQMANEFFHSELPLTA